MLDKLLSKYKNMSMPAKAAIWFAVCNILQKGISVITVPIFTRLLSTEEYGIYSLYLSWLNILTVFTSLNLYYGVFNNAMLKYEDDRDRYTSSMQGLVVISTAIVFGIYLIAKDGVNQLSGLSTICFILMFIELLITPSLQFWSARQRFDYKYKKLVVLTLAKSILNPLLGIIAVVASNGGALSRIVATVAVELSFCGVLAVYQFRKGKCFYSRQYWSYALKFNIPLLPHYLSGTILNQADRVMIQSLVGTTEVAIYSVAYNVGMLMQLFTNAINSSFTPWFYVGMQKGRYKKIRTVSNVLLLVMASLVILLMFFAPEVIMIFAPEQYYEAIYVIPPVSASVFFVYLYSLFSNLEFYYEKTIFIMIGSVSAALLNVLLNAIFISKFGYVAAGYTTLVSYCLYSLAHHVFCTMISKKYLGGKTVYDLKMVLIMSVVVIAAAILFNFLYDFFILRYLMAAVLLVVLFMKRNVVIDILKEFKNKD